MERYKPLFKETLISSSIPQELRPEVPPKEDNDILHKKAGEVKIVKIGSK